MKKLKVKKCNKHRLSKGSGQLKVIVKEFDGGIQKFAKQYKTSRQNIYNWCKGCELSYAAKVFLNNEFDIPLSSWNEYI